MTIFTYKDLPDITRKMNSFIFSEIVLIKKTFWDQNMKRRRIKGFQRLHIEWSIQWVYILGGYIHQGFKTE